MRLQLLKDQFKKMMRDEKGAVISSETLIVIVGSSIVASVVVGVITVMLTGDDKDGKGGIAGNVTENVNKLMEDMIED